LLLLFIKHLSDNEVISQTHIIHMSGMHACSGTKSTYCVLVVRIPTGVLGVSWAQLLFKALFD